MTATSELLAASNIAELRQEYDRILALHRQNPSQRGLWAPVYEQL